MSSARVHLVQPPALSVNGDQNQVVCALQKMSNGVRAARLHRHALTQTRVMHALAGDRLLSPSTGSTVALLR